MMIYQLISLNGTFAINVNKLVSVQKTLKIITFLFELNKVQANFESEEKATEEYERFIHLWAHYGDDKPKGAEIIDLNE